MGCKFEKFSVVFFMVLTITVGIFIASSWGTNITEYNKNQFEIEDNAILLNGTIESIDYLQNGDLYLKINGKTYEVNKYLWRDDILSSTGIISDEEKVELFYYTIEIGDNIIVYESYKIYLNGEFYQKGYFSNWSWFAWVITFIPIVIIMILLIVYLTVFVGYIKEELQDDIKGLKKKIRMLEREIAEEKAKKELIRINGKPFKFVKQPEFLQLYCNNCGSKIDLREGNCKYCGTEVRLE